jgi:hypothetical protein
MSDDYTLVKSEIAYYIGTPESEWDARTVDDVDSCIRKGIDQVVHCGIHQWSWLRPIYSFNTVADTRTYTLPVGFEQFIGDLIFDGENYNYPPITQSPAARLYQMYSESTSSGVPTRYALSATAHDGETEQQQQLILHPTPDAVYTLCGIYQVGPIQTLTTAVPYFHGGREHRELFIASCLAVAEQKFLDGKGDKQESFQMALNAAIQRDHRRAPRNLGQMGSKSNGRDWFRHRLSVTASAGEY